MTDIVVPVTTVWDVIANALDDGYFWLASAVGLFAIALIIRRRIGRRCCICPSLR
ncbi:MAG: hypothetical protein SPC89_05615 [Candidatus Methanarcanum hacksteinii]|nr:hypothetical protein [Candidatus Methanarcanum hacksteinii]